MASLGQRIKEGRKKLNLTQEELGKICGVTKFTISLYESDKSTPSDEIKKIMTEKFEVSMDYLMGITNYINNNFDFMVKENDINKEYLVNTFTADQLIEFALEKYKTKCEKEGKEFNPYDIIKIVTNSLNKYEEKE